MIHDFDICCHVCGATLRLDDHRKLPQAERKALIRAWIRQHAEHTRAALDQKAA